MLYAVVQHEVEARLARQLPLPRALGSVFYAHVGRVVVGAYHQLALLPRLLRCGGSNEEEYQWKKG